MGIKKILKLIFQKTTLKRQLFFLLGDILLISFSLYIAFLLRFAGNITSQYLQYLFIYIVFSLTTKIGILMVSGLYNVTWTYFGIGDLLSLWKSLTYSTLLMAVFLYIFRTHSVLGLFPSSVLIIDYILSLFLLGGFRSLKRIYSNLLKKQSLKGGIPVLIVGAGDAGEQVVRHMFSTGHQNLNYKPIGFIDDSPSKQSTFIHGIPVFGTTADLPDVVKSHNIEEIIIAFPSASSKAVKQTVKTAKLAGISKIKIIPEYAAIVGGDINLADIREVRLEDLLGRESIKIDTNEIESYIKGKIILITGAAGSIGSELCRQIVRFEPSKIILFDQDESGLFDIDFELSEKMYAIPRINIVGDIIDKNRIEQVFSDFKPDVVFHAAAYKHVPLMEEQPYEAVINNILGTLNVAEAAIRHEVNKFIFISTDKAVNPVSVMGMTKRIGEMLVTNLNQHEKTIFSSIRFGNVLGSRGSVVQVFKEQIKHMGPLKVTHPDMERYFIVASEAILLILQAGAIGKGGEVFVLDMGSPVKIVDLARELIQLSGYQPDIDIPIVFTELRPGERLSENLFTDEEKLTTTKREKIFEAKIKHKFSDYDLLAKIDKLTKEKDKQKIVEILKELTNE